MQTTEDDRPTELQQPVHATTFPPGGVDNMTDTSVALCIWEQLGLLLERYQSQTIAERPKSD